MSPFRALITRLAEFEIWPVALLVVASMALTRLLPLAVIVAAAYWPARLLAFRKLSVRTPADFSIALLFVMVPVTLWATALPETTLPQVYRLLAGIGLYYAIVNWTNSTSRLRMLVAGMVLAGFALALVAPFSVEWFINKLSFIPASIYDRFTPLASDPIHPNVMAGSLVILLPVSLAILLFGWKDPRRYLRLGFVLSVLWIIAVLFLTKSRGAWVALGAVVILLVALRWRWGWTALPLGLLVGGIAALLLGIPQFLDLLSTSGSINGIGGRIEIWSRAIYMIQDFPFTGIGLGSFGYLADTLYPFFTISPGSIPHAHNLFLQLAVDLGIPGLIAWLATWGTMVLIAWQVYRQGKSLAVGWIAGLGAGLLGSQVALVVHGFLDAVTWGMVKPAPIVWGLWGLTVASWYVCCRPSGQSLPSHE